MTRLTPRDALLAGGLALVVAAVHVAYYDRGFILLDEGYVTTIAAQLARGGELYRDAVTYVLPGSFRLLALAFRLLGESVWTARVLTLALTATMAALVYLAGRAALAPAAAALAGALFTLLSVWAYPQWHVYQYSAPSLVAVLGAVALLVRRDAAARPGRLLAAGLLVSAALFCKQNYGGAAAVLLGLFLLGDGAACGARAGAVRAFSPFALGVAGPVGVYAAALAARGLLDEFVRQTVLAPLAGARTFSYVRLPSLRPLLHQDPALRAGLWNYLPPLLLELRWPQLQASALYRDTPILDAALKTLLYLPILVPGLAAAWLAVRLMRSRRAVRRWWARDRGAVLLLVTAAVLLLALNRPHDWVHVSLAYPGTLLVLVWLASEAPPRARRVALSALAGATTLALWPTLRLVADLRAAMSDPIPVARAGVRARPADAEVVARLVSTVTAATRPGEPILVVPYHPLVYFLADRPPATRFLFIWYEYLRERDDEILAALDARRVRTVVYASLPAPPLGTLAEYGPALLAGLVERYRVAELVGREPWGVSFLVLEPRPPSRPGTVVLDTRLSAGHATRVVDGRRAEVPLAEQVRETVWPFERVLAVRPTPGGVAELRLPMPPGARGRLALGYGMNPDRWVSERPVPVTFRAALETDGDTVTLVEDTRDPQRLIDERLWPARSFPLDGRPATLVLQVAAPPGAPDDPDLVGWTLPRIEP